MKKKEREGTFRDEKMKWKKNILLKNAIIIIIIIIKQHKIIILRCLAWANQH